MDRRSFLNAASILGGGFVAMEASGVLIKASADVGQSLVEASESSESDIDRVPNIGIVAIGDLGGWILNRLHGKLPHLYRSVFVGDKPLLLHRIAADVRIQIDRLAFDGLAPQIDPDFNDSFAKKIASSLGGVDRLFIVASMSDGMLENKVALFVAALARRAKIMTVAAFGYAPQPLIRSANRGGRYSIYWPGQLGIPIVSLSDGCYCTNNLSGFKSISDRFVMAAAFERLYRSVSVIQDDRSLISQEKEDVQAFFSNALNYDMVVAYGSAWGAESVEISTRMAVSHPFFCGADYERIDGEFLISIEARPGYMGIKNINRALRVIRDACPSGFLLFGGFRNPQLNCDFHVTVIGPRQLRDFVDGVALPR